MITINNKKIDLMFQVEKDTPLNKILNSLTLDINVILIVCPSIFFSNVIGDLYDLMIDQDQIHLAEGSDIVEFKIKYKKKEFDFIFLVTPSDDKILNIPMQGQKIFNIGFKKTEFL